MKNIALIFVLVIISFFLDGMSFAQTFQEVVILKNGSVIKGVILEQIPDSTITIQLSDGNQLVYPMSAVMKISKERSIVGTERENIPSEKKEWWSDIDTDIFSKPFKTLIYGSYSLAVGKFGSKESGLAASGFFLGNEGAFKYNSNLSLIYNLSYSYNSLNAPSGFQINGGYSTIWPAIGAKYEIPFSPGNNYYGIGGLGLAINSGPTAKIYNAVTRKTREIDLGSDVSSSVMLGGGIVINNRYNFGIRYFHCVADYNGGNISTSILGFIIGWQF